MRVTCTFPKDEAQLLNGGAGPNAFKNWVPGTWTQPLVVTGGAPGHLLGPGATGTDDALSQLQYPAGPVQTTIATVWRTGAPAAAELETHTYMSMVFVDGANDLIYSHEHDWTATIMSEGVWRGPKAAIDIPLSNTVTELVDGDVIKSIDTNGLTVQEFINDVFQFSYNDAANIVPTGGKFGVGMDNDATTFGFRTITFDDGLTPFIPGVPPQWASRLGA